METYNTSDTHTGEHQMAMHDALMMAAGQLPDPPTDMQADCAGAVDAAHAHLEQMARQEGNTVS